MNSFYENIVFEKNQDFEYKIQEKKIIRKDKTLEQIENHILILNKKKGFGLKMILS